MGADQLRRGLPPLPERMRQLPLDPRGYPIPWFVGSVDGKRDFRVMDDAKRLRAVKQRLCWLCGEKVGKYLAFVIGPMCAVNRNTAEPGSHRECAEFAVRACPFLMLPRSEYRPPPAGGKMLAGMLPGNPGASCVWVTEHFMPYPVGRETWLIRLGDPHEVLWFAEGKPATRQQILDSFAARLPHLEAVAKDDGPEAEQQLRAMVADAMQLLPA